MNKIYCDCCNKKIKNKKYFEGENSGYIYCQNCAELKLSETYIGYIENEINDIKDFYFDDELSDIEVFFLKML